ALRSAPRLREGTARRPRARHGGRRPPGRPSPPTHRSDTGSLLAWEQRSIALQVIREAGATRALGYAELYRNRNGFSARQAASARPTAASRLPSSCTRTPPRSAL